MDPERSPQDPELSASSPKTEPFRQASENIMKHDPPREKRELLAAVLREEAEDAGSLTVSQEFWVIGMAREDPQEPTTPIWEDVQEIVCKQRLLRLALVMCLINGPTWMFVGFWIWGSPGWNRALGLAAIGASLGLALPRLILKLRSAFMLRQLRATWPVFLERLASDFETAQSVRPISADALTKHADPEPLAVFFEVQHALEHSSALRHWNAVARIARRQLAAPQTSEIPVTSDAWTHWGQVMYRHAPLPEFRRWFQAVTPALIPTPESSSITNANTNTNTFEAISGDHAEKSRRLTQLKRKRRQATFRELGFWIFMIFCLYGLRQLLIPVIRMMTFQETDEQLP